MLKVITISLLVWKFVLLVIAYIAAFILPLQQAFTIYRDRFPDLGVKLPYLVSIWGNFDGFFYLSLAKRWYFENEYPFFPLYPLLVKPVAELLRLEFVLAGQLVSLVSFTLALFIVVKLLNLDRAAKLFGLVLLIILTFPMSYSYSATYNDSLFFLLACLTLYFSRKKQWLFAGLAGGLASLTRLNGLALLFPVAIEYLTRGRRNFSRFGVAILAIPAGFLSYLVYVNQAFDSWQKVFTTMSIWGQEKVTFPLQVFWRYGKILFTVAPNQLTYWVAVFELSVVFFYIFLLVWSFRKIRLSYWMFFAVSLLIPSLTGTFAGMPRYGLHLYPLFLTVALILEKKSGWIKFFYFAISLALLFFAVTLFTRGYFIA